MPRVGAATLLIVVFAVATAFAQPVCLDGDADADTICDGADNCPVDANTDQSDVDDDGAGDVCDPVDGPMFQSKVTLKGGPLGLRGQAKAYVQVMPPTATLDVSTGVTVSMADGDGMTVAATLAPSDCIASRGGIRCLSPDRTTRLVMKPATKALGYFRFRARVNTAAVAPAFVAPATVEVTLGDVTYQAVATICTTKTRAMTCRYPPP